MEGNTGEASGSSAANETGGAGGNGAESQDATNKMIPPTPSTVAAASSATDSAPTNSTAAISSSAGGGGTPSQETSASSVTAQQQQQDNNVVKKEKSDTDTKENSNPEEPASNASNATASTMPSSETAPVDDPNKKKAEGGGDQSEDSDDDDEEEVVEESPCGRYNKRKEVVKYRDVPGIDTAFLAMDTEEGVEVVWNEASFSGSKKFKSQEDKLKNVFDALTVIDHPNIVKFHRYWIDGGKDKTSPRLVFITEYMSSGSLKQFLRKTKKNNRKTQVQSWKRWCTQILSALNYLHVTCDPPILHGNLTCETIFIQHNGLVKIGSVAPDIIHQNVKTCRDSVVRHRHYLAPEWGTINATAGSGTVNTAIDIYAFGICALETAALELMTTPSKSQQQDSANGKDPGAANGNGGGQHEKESEGIVTEESIQRTIDSLEDEDQKDFIRRCLHQDPEKRPTARQLLFHRVLFEVHSLKLLAAHVLVQCPEVDTSNINETMTDEAIQTHYGKDTVMATARRNNGVVEYKLSDFPVAEKLEKFMEDVKYGIYPLTAFALSQPELSKTRAVTPEGTNESDKSVTPDPVEKEQRWGLDFRCYIGPPYPLEAKTLVLQTRMCDFNNRQMSTFLHEKDTPEILAEDLYNLSIINWRDVIPMAKLLTLAWIQRANEIADYEASVHAGTLVRIPDEDLAIYNRGPAGRREAAAAAAQASASTASNSTEVVASAAAALATTTISATSNSSAAATAGDQPDGINKTKNSQKKGGGGSGGSGSGGSSRAHHQPRINKKKLKKRHKKKADKKSPAGSQPSSQDSANNWKVHNSSSSSSSAGSSSRSVKSNLSVEDTENPESIDSFKNLPSNTAATNTVSGLEELEYLTQVAPQVLESLYKKAEDGEMTRDIIEKEFERKPTAPQPLEGRLAGIEPAYGTPDMTFGEAVIAGKTRGGLHLPKEFKFTPNSITEELDTELTKHLKEFYEHVASQEKARQEAKEQREKELQQQQQQQQQAQLQQQQQQLQQQLQQQPSHDNANNAS